MSTNTDNHEADTHPPTEGAGTPPLSESLLSEAARIMDAARENHAAWERMALWTDTFGPRLSGTEALERAIDWALDAMTQDGLQNVHGEPVMVPHWVRGQESCEMLAPRPMALSMIGLGGSVGTGPDGVVAEVMVVESFDELERRADEAKGKIVLFDVPYVGYGQTVAYRARGAMEAGRRGAVAALVRSIASGWMNNPHTGGMRYEDGVDRIPTAALSVEHAMLLHRLAARGDRVVVRLAMGAHQLPDAPSRNVVAEIVGSERPEEVVVLGGHIDSWDVGQGAMDDAGGFVASWEALNVIRRLGLKPRRTIRVVGWTNEENGLRGGTGYRDAHLAEVSNHVVAMESDAGFFRPTRMGFHGDPEGLPIIERIAAVMASAGPFSAGEGGPGADISPLATEGVPTLSLGSDSNQYFRYHHSAADTPDKVDPDELAHGVGVLGVYAYVLAQWPGRLKGRPFTRRLR
jgi:carboxypeptidase Q